MKELMYLLRAIRIYSQNAHHLVKGTPFHSDHNFFGDVYNEVGGDFDDVAERIIGLYGEEHLNLQNMLQAVVAKLVDAPSTGVSDNKVFYEYQFKMEDKLKNLIKQIIASGVSPGVEQLIGDIANKSEMRCYKIKQRMK
jgi:DNA-binding ferritin-like protein